MNLNCDYKGMFYLIVLIFPDDLLNTDDFSVNLTDRVGDLSI